MDAEKRYVKKQDSVAEMTKQGEQGQSTSAVVVGSIREDEGPVEFPALKLLNRSYNIPAFITDRYARSILANLSWMLLIDAKHLIDGGQQLHRNATRAFQAMRMSLSHNDEQVVRKFMSFSPLVHTQFLIKLHKSGAFLEQLTREIEQKERSSNQLSELIGAMHSVIQRLKWICLSCVAKVKERAQPIAYRDISPVESIRYPAYQKVQQPTTETSETTLSSMVMLRTQHVRESKIRKQRSFSNTHIGAFSRNPRGIPPNSSKKLSRSNEQLHSAR
mmetsp:Transcript_33080/g.46178  ORF Transcript_33080/g.46178 Transcript_33080/m.46178 type:complete len:275 (+) Transcript_33080:731-1555(+)